MLRLHVSLYLTLSLIGQEEKETILENRTANRTAKLTAFQIVSGYARGNIEIGVRVECSIAPELKRTAVNLVAARFGYDADHSRPVAAVLRRVVAGQDTKLRHRIRVGIVDHSIA